MRVNFFFAASNCIRPICENIYIMLMPTVRRSFATFTPAEFISDRYIPTRIIEMPFGVAHNYRDRVHDSHRERSRFFVLSRNMGTLRRSKKCSRGDILSDRYMNRYGRVLEYTTGGQRAFVDEMQRHCDGTNE